MQKSKALALQIAGAAAFAMLCGTSAFAESRHLQGTRGFSRPSSGRITVHAPRFESRHFAAPRFGSRVTPAWHSTPRSWGRGVPFRGYNRGYNSFRGYNSGARFFGRGRIQRIVPYPGGYRVWLGGWGYPFFVPYRFYDPFRFRIGLFIGFNAFYNPYGYYSVYGWPGYYPYYRSYRPAYGYGSYGYRDDYGYSRSYGNRDDYGYSSDVLRGIVESVDLHSGYVMVKDDTSQRVITALLPPRDRRVDNIRPGDYVEFTGEWVRGRGYEFDADRMERFDPRR